MAVVGGAISGSVAAEILADHGVRVAVIEQNKRPYGKIEDGLPRWHVEQRKQEYARIDARMKKPGVYFVPCTRLGRDIRFRGTLRDWGFSAVILANGAWRDRDLGVPGADEYVDKGLVYQNPFIYWYNHKNEKDYSGPRYDTPDEALVVGGGLASIDVVKVLQIENYERALRARGIQINMHELEKGIPAACKAHGVDPASLGVKGCLLIYRRREQDMPLAQPPDNATPDQIAKTEIIRQKMLRLAQEKYLFRVQERSVATGLIVENGRVVGLKVADTQIEGRRCRGDSWHGARAARAAGDFVHRFRAGGASGRGDEGRILHFRRRGAAAVCGRRARVWRGQRGHRAGEYPRVAGAQPESDETPGGKLFARGR